MFEFKNKIILITGAASGMGKALAEDLSDKGAIIIANYHDRKKEAEELLKKLEKDNPLSRIYQADISNQEEVSKLFQNIKDFYGKLDGLVNCAGIVEFRSLESCDQSSIDQQIKVNLLGTIYTTKEALNLLRKSDCGSVVNISSGRYPKFKTLIA